MTENIKNRPAKLARPIALIGMMGAGKTTIGRKLADHLAVPFADSDEVIEAQTGLSVAQIFAEQGEEQFRALEAEVVARLLAAPKTGVIALGGGALGNPASSALVRQKAATIWLKAPPALLSARIKSKPNKRPLLEDGDKHAILTQLLAQREPIYQGACITIDAARSCEQIMENIIRALRAKKILRSSITQ